VSVATVAKRLQLDKRNHLFGDPSVPVGRAGSFARSASSEGSPNATARRKPGADQIRQEHACFLKAQREFVLPHRGVHFPYGTSTGEAMGNDSKDTFNKLKHDTKDTVDEAKHRTQAAGEHLKRDVAGNAMPMGDRIMSNVKETVHKTQADVDAAKRDVRHGGDDKV
jgi:hypothetical protein